MFAIQTGWIAPAGPDLDVFEWEFCTTMGNPHAVVLSSCTGAIHLALLLVGVKAGDQVLCLTAAASAKPALFIGARLEEAIADRIRPTGHAPRGLILVHIYGQLVDIDPIPRICEWHGIVLVEEAAEFLGCLHRCSTRGAGCARHYGPGWHIFLQRQ